VKWYRLAADQGDADAQYNLGVCYAKGEGVPQDKVLAYMWHDLASANGLKRAERKKGQLEKRLTRQQIAEAQKLSREWKPKG
jgi:TPR repeat protein